jgi:hypothetical protein
VACRPLPSAERSILLTRRSLIAVVCAFGAALLLSASGAFAADPNSPVSLSPDPLAFGGVRIGTTASRTVTVTNNGANPIDTITASTSGAPFSVSNNGCSGLTLATGEHCDVTVDFSPTAAVVPDGTLTVNANDTALPGPITPQSAVLTGSGTAPATAWSPTSGLDFATGKGTTSDQQTLTLQNTGTAPLQVTSDPTLGGDNPLQFHIVGGTCGNGTVVAANGGGCTIVITYQPSSTLTAAATVSIDTELGLRTAPLNGTVQQAGIAFTPPEGWNFGPQQNGTLSSIRTITVQNTGAGPLHIFGTAIVGTNYLNFVKGTDTCANTTVQNGGQCSVVVRFSPNSVGAKSALLRVASDAGTADFGYVYANLSGTGTYPPTVVGLRGAVGCHAARLTWTNPSAPRLLRVQVVRNASHVPHGPTDGTVLQHQVGLLSDTGLAQLRTYNYAVYGVYSAWNSERLVYSRAGVRSLHTGRVCTPMNGSIIHDLTPFVDWTPYGTNPRYAIRVVRSGTTILVRYTTATGFQIPTSWTYNGATHRLAKGSSYYAYVYAYTSAYPTGRWIGQTHFTEG